MPVHESEPCYWDVRVDGKRPRTLANASYRDDDARSESEDDPEDVFKPGRDHDYAIAYGAMHYSIASSSYACMFIIHACMYACVY